MQLHGRKKPMETGKAKQTVDTRSRLSVLENNVNILTTNVEKLEVKIDTNYATLHSRISDLRDDLREDFEKKNDKVIKKIEEHNAASTEHTLELNKRMTQLEKWRWMIMGAALVLGYVVAHIRLEKLF